MNKSGLPPLQANTVRAGNKQQRMGSHPTQGQDCHIPLSSKPLNCPKLGNLAHIRAPPGSTMKDTVILEV